MRGAVDALPELEAFEATLTLSGAETIKMEIYNLVISNGRYVAAGIPVAPQAKLDDGLLDVMIAPATALPNLALLLPQVLLGRHLNSDLLLFRKATRIEIDSTPPMTFNVDGEILSGAALFELLPRALEMVVGEARFLLDLLDHRRELARGLIIDHDVGFLAQLLGPFVDSWSAASAPGPPGYPRARRRAAAPAGRASASRG